MDPKPPNYDQQKALRHELVTKFLDEQLFPIVRGGEPINTQRASAMLKSFLQQHEGPVEIDLAMVEGRIFKGMLKGKEDLDATGVETEEYKLYKQAWKLFDDIDTEIASFGPTAYSDE